MSRDEAFFNPRSLWRVAEHVEWEDDLTFYRDGTSNHERYAQACTILMERYMAGYSYYEFRRVAEAWAAGGARWAFEAWLGGIVDKATILRGIWAGFTADFKKPPPAAKAFQPLSPFFPGAPAPTWIFADAQPAPTDEERLLQVFDGFFSKLHALSEPLSG